MVIGGRVWSIEILISVHTVAEGLDLPKRFNIDCRIYEKLHFIGSDVDGLDEDVSLNLSCNYEMTTNKKFCFNKDN